MLRSFYKLYLLLIIGVAISAVVVVPGVQYLFVTRAMDSSIQGVYSNLYILRDVLSRKPEADWPKMLDARRPMFALIEFDLIPRARWTFTPAESTALDLGYAIEHTPGELLVMIKPSQTMLRVSQVRETLAVNTFLFIAWSSIAVVLLGGLFIWLRAHWRDLERLRVAAEGFGQGKLDVRAGLPAGSSISPLSRRFDSMAGRIETLVTTQNDMINAISHELRTPIARFGFGLALLQSAKTTDDQQRYIEALGRDITELDQLVGELLSYGALSQMDRSTDCRQVNLIELIDSVAGSLALEMELLGVQCTTSISVAAEQVVLDPRLTARALINLARNAMRYGHGKIVITASVDRGKLIVWVDDDGIGIPDADRKTIFEPFHRLDRSRDRNTGGFGLGLAIAKRAIQSQGGRIDVVDSPLGGARFEILLPYPGDTEAMGSLA